MRCLVSTILFKSYGYAKAEGPSRYVKLKIIYYSSLFISNGFTMFTYKQENSITNYNAAVIILNI